LDNWAASIRHQRWRIDPTTPIKECMATPHNRQPKGQSDGGQFAPSQNPEATVQPTTFSEARNQPAALTDGQWQSRAAQAERVLDDIVELARTPGLSGADVVGALDEILVAAGYDVSWPKDEEDVEFDRFAKNLAAARRAISHAD
jgi:hypothetical protein